MPNKQATEIVNNKGKPVKPEAADLNFDGFMLYSLKTALRLAWTRSEVYQNALKEYLEYLEFLVIRHRDYYGEAVSSFDEEFRSSAKSDQYSLSDVQHRGILCYKHFHAKGRRQIAQSASRSGKKK